eukprot:XP_016657744.1 PREDICTED: charged multivesicular body protein 4b-like [Acyrthosiphon pisum]
MSFLRKLFGRKKKEIKGPSRSTEVDALEKLRSTEQLLRDKSEALKTNIETEQSTVKENVIKNKQVALKALNRKKRYERQLSRNESMLLSVIKQQSALENANTNNIAVDLMSSTSYAVKMANQNVNIDDINNMIDDIATSKDLTQDITEAICNPTRLETDEDEEELQKELENLELEKLDEQVINIDPVQATNQPIPVVPKTKENITRHKNSIIT